MFWDGVSSFLRGCTYDKMMEFGEEMRVICSINRVHFLVKKEKISILHLRNLILKVVEPNFSRQFYQQMMQKYENMKPTTREKNNQQQSFLNSYHLTHQTNTNRPLAHGTNDVSIPPPPPAGTLIHNP